MQKFTLLRNSGFGDYVGTAKAVSAILGPEYQYVVCNQLRYINYHCRELDFIKMFFKGEYIDAIPNDIIYISLRHLLNNPNIPSNKILAITVDNEDFKLIVKLNRPIPKSLKSLFNYESYHDPFGTLANKVTLHFRATDLISNKKLIRPMINPHKVVDFVNSTLNKTTHMIICSDTPQNSPYHQLINNMVFASHIIVVDKFIGTDTDTTIKVMDAIYHSDMVISKSSSFINVFNVRRVIVPDQYCYTHINEITF